MRISNQKAILLPLYCPSQQKTIPYGPMIKSHHKPLIIQSDSSLLADTHDPGFEEVRSKVSAFAELEKSPEHIHTYRISPLSLWNASSAGISSTHIIEVLQGYSRYPIPENVIYTIKDITSRFGKILLEPAQNGDHLFLSVAEETIRREILADKKLQRLVDPVDGGFKISLFNRGTVKQELLRIGYPVKDVAPLKDGEHFPLSLKAETGSGEPLVIRDYQRDAVNAFVGDKEPGTGFGTIVLPCGSGKTIIGIAALAELKVNTLIVTTNVASVHQWKREILDKTDITIEDIGEYTGEEKKIRPVTIATYQVLVWRENRDADFPHFTLFRKREWGFIIYDEVHLLPAPVFRVTAELQAIRRLGLTATLVREDNREEDVFSLVGPKRYDFPWRDLESMGWIAQAECVEIRVELEKSLKIPYAGADKRGKFRIASTNPNKKAVVYDLVQKNPSDYILVIGQYLDQLKEIARELGAPIITGKTPNREREQLYTDFRKKKLRVIVTSKVANFAIDLPDASMAIQVSGTFGSRQEEAQRLGRILRPKERCARFYTLVTRYTTEETFSSNRQKFLTEQGYRYKIESWDTIKA